MIQVNVHEAKTQLSRLLEAVEAGEAVVIARAGVPIAVLSRFKGTTLARRKLGLFGGQATIHDDFDSLPVDLLQALSGEDP
jgi:antitoxin (DNA-binding transcriptional repressor) of toxin-antitoxin stability system